MTLSFNFKLLYAGIIIKIIYFKFMPGSAQLLMTTREMRVEKFQVCPNSENLPMTFSDILITQSNHNAIELSAKVTVTETLGNQPVQLLMELQKCPSRDEVATCEYYTRIKVKDCCEATSIFSTFMKGTTVPNCPIKPGVYYYNKAKFNLTDVRFLPLFDAYWKIKSTATEEKKVLSCIFFDFTLKHSTKKIRV